MTDEVIAALGIEGLPQKAQEEAVAAVGETIMQAVTVAVLLRLPEDKQDEFKDLVDKNDAKGIDALLRAHIPDLDAFMQSEIQKEVGAFKAEMEKQLAQ